MNFKLSTKEKFSQIELDEPQLSANMTAQMAELLSECMKKPEKNLVMSLQGVNAIDKSIALLLLDWQTIYYEQRQSFVICQLEPEIENTWDKDGLLEQLNVTPTLSEAWDIVQMEEIERELFADYDENEGAE